MNPTDRTRVLRAEDRDLRPEQDRKMSFCEFNQIRRRYQKNSPLHGGCFFVAAGAARTGAKRPFDGTRGQRAIFLCNEVDTRLCRVAGESSSVCAIRDFSVSDRCRPYSCSKCSFRLENTVEISYNMGDSGYKMIYYIQTTLYNGRQPDEDGITAIQEKSWLTIRRFRQQPQVAI